MRPRAMTSLEKSPITIPSDVPSPDRLPLVETPRHEKDDTQDQYGDHASGQKTAAVTSHEIHHVGSRKWLILRPKRIANIPSSNRPGAGNLILLCLGLLPAQAIGAFRQRRECYGEVLTTAIGFRPRGLGATRTHFRWRLEGAGQRRCS